MNNQNNLNNYLFISWAVSLIATLGSLFFSEVMMFIPCELCWYQRILMYPLVIILGIALVKKDYSISLYSFVLSTIGGLISIYHLSIQKISFMGEHSLSCGMIPCNVEYINWMGFITIPFLALIAFVLISIFSLITMKTYKELD
ncbi:disulfide oxidoreductase [Bacillus sp. SCS-151]|uniref:disulfide oxidoreductase n=1 Tax=Nanhaiella sioensis TaxID=3115293 RepID=UPI00397948C2